MQTVAFSSQPTRPFSTCETRDPHDDDRMSRVSAVWALLEEIKGREPSRGELIQVIGAATAGTLTDASCARVADAVLALWNR
jgi:hypothetical protein